MALFAGVATSPWFSLGLVVFGVGYLVFVGEPRGAVRHALAPVVGWAVVGMAVIIFGAAMLVSYTAAVLDPDRRAALESIAALEGGDTIVLHCEPITRSVQIIVDRSLLLPDIEYQVESNKIKLKGPTVGITQSTLAEPGGNVTVWYTKRKADCK
jgi:hypothetical protein